MPAAAPHLTAACRKKPSFKKKVADERNVRRGGNAPELLNEDGDAGPSAQAQRPVDSSADGQPAAHMIDGDMPAKQKQGVQWDLGGTPKQKRCFFKKILKFLPAGFDNFGKEKNMRTSVTSRRKTLVAVSTRSKLTTMPERQRVSANCTLAGCTHTRAPRMSVARHSCAPASRSTAPLARRANFTAWRGRATRATRGYSAASRSALSSAGSPACALSSVAEAGWLAWTSPAEASAERRSFRRALMSRIVVVEM